MPEHLQIVRLVGGLGNQLFQYAFAVAQERPGVIVRLHSLLPAQPRGRADRGLGYDSRGWKPRPYALQGWPGPQVEKNPWTLWRAGAHLDRGFARPLRPWLPWLRWAELQYRESDVARLPEIQARHDVSYWSGGFQEEAFFAAGVDRLREILREQLAAALPAGGATAAAFAQPRPAIQIRRGDYARLEQTRPELGYYCPSVDYYVRGLAEMGVRPGAMVLVFSDDPAWCREHLPPTYQWEFVEAPGALANLALLSRCSPLVISNSSFGWWGAWIAQHVHGAPADGVVAPLPWSLARTVTPLPPAWRLLAARA